MAKKLDFSGLEDAIFSGGVVTRDETALEQDEFSEPKSIEEAMFQGGVVTRKADTTLAEDVKSTAMSAAKTYAKTYQAVTEVPMALATGMAAMSYAGYEAMLTEPEEGMTSTEQIHKRMGEYTYQPEGEYSKTIMNGLGAFGEFIVDHVKVASDAGYEAATWLGLPKEGAAATGAAIQTAGEWFALPLAFKGITTSVKVAGATIKGVGAPMESLSKFNAEVKTKAADNLLDQIYTRLGTIDGIIDTMDQAAHVESVIPGYKFDLSGATMSPYVKAVSQEVVSKLDSAKVRTENLAKNNKEAVVNFVESIYGKNSIDAPRATIEKIVKNANGKMSEVIKGIADEVVIAETKLTDLRLKMIAPKTEHLSKAFEAAFEQNLKMNKAFGQALYERIGSIDVNYQNVFDSAKIISENKSQWKQGEFPSIVDDIIKRGTQNSEAVAATVNKKTAQLQKMQELAQKDPNFDVTALKKLSDEIEGLKQQPPTVMSFKELREIDKAVNKDFSIESKGINTRPNARVRSKHLGTLRKEISKAMDVLERSTDTKVVNQYREAKKYWSEEVVGKFQTGALKDLMAPGDSLSLKAKSYESMVDSVFKAATDKKAGVRGIRDVLEAIDGSALGMVALKETIIKKFAKETEVSMPVSGTKINEKLLVVDRNKAAKFIDKYSEMLDEVPAIKAMLSDESKVIEAIEWQKRNALLRENAVKDSNLYKVVGDKDPYTSFISMMKTKDSMKTMMGDAHKYGIDRETLVRTAVSAVIRKSRKETPDKSFALDPEAAKTMIRENEGLKLLLGADHSQYINTILRAEEGALFAPKIIHTEKGTGGAISKVTEMLGRSPGSYITDLRAYYQGRTSMRQVLSSGAASIFLRMNKHNELLVKEAAMYDKPLAKHIYEIKKRIDRGEVPPDKLFKDTAARIHTLGISKHIFGKIVGVVKEGMPIKKVGGKRVFNKEIIKPALLAPIYEQGNEASQ